MAHAAHAKRGTDAAFGTVCRVALLLAGCGDVPDDLFDEQCSTGVTRACSGEARCSGKQLCESSRWGECLCEHDREAGVSASLGGECSRVDDCPMGAFCLSPSDTRFFGGGPPVGVCVADCAEDPSVCEAFAGATCASLSLGSSGMERLCFPACQFGTSVPDKCRGIPHSACAPLEDGEALEGFCRPLCATSGDCAVGVCDAAEGVCVEWGIDDTTFGLLCTEGEDGDLTGDPCHGLCVSVEEAPAICSRRCVFGDSEECAPSSGGLRRGGCVIASPGGLPGDLGFCAELCDCSEDCIDRSMVCDAFDDSTLESVFRRKGVCTLPELVVRSQLDCGDA